MRTADAERKIGSWQVGEPEEALAFFGRKYDDLAVQVDLLEQRLASGAAAPDETPERRPQAPRGACRGTRDRRPRGAVPTAWTPSTIRWPNGAPSDAQNAPGAGGGRDRKEHIVGQAEAIAESDDWRHGADRLRTLLEEWKALPRLDRATDDVLWRRFSSARTHYTRRRKTHFAEVAERRDQARAAKEEIVVEAEAFAARPIGARRRAATAT